MVSFNRAVLAGNLTRDPELRVTQSGVPVCRARRWTSLTLLDRGEPHQVKVSAWRELGETVANYKKKGDPVLVEGRLQYRTWQAQDGAKRSAVDVVADRIQFLSRGTNPQAQAEEAPAAANKASAETAAAGGWGLAKQLQVGGADDTDPEEED
jgi:single-strand DNA-binding protein